MERRRGDEGLKVWGGGEAQENSKPSREIHAEAGSIVPPEEKPTSIADIYPKIEDLQNSEPIALESQIKPVDSEETQVVGDILQIEDPLKIQEEMGRVFEQNDSE
jgi:hypothetical protein